MHEGRIGDLKSMQESHKKGDPYGMRGNAKKNGNAVRRCRLDERVKNQCVLSSNETHVNTTLLLTSVVTIFC